MRWLALTGYDNRDISRRVRTVAQGCEANRDRRSRERQDWSSYGRVAGDDEYRP